MRARLHTPAHTYATQRRSLGATGAPRRVTTVLFFSRRHVPTPRPLDRALPPQPFLKVSPSPVSPPLPPSLAHARITQKRINNTRESASMKTQRWEGRDRSRLTAVVHVVVFRCQHRGAARRGVTCRRISRSPPWYTYSRTHPTGGRRDSGREI